MIHAKTDRLGRATFHHIVRREDIRPTAREVRWFKHIERHGPQASTYLYELTRDTHSCRDTALRQMQKLRAGGFLQLPPQQRATEHANFNPYVYNLTRKAQDHLFELGHDAPTIRPTGHWWHGYLTACVTSSIDITAARQDVQYIPAHEILALEGASFEIPLPQGKLIPDQLFALNYGASFRAFALEVDCGTEPVQSAAARKSLARSIQTYADVIEQERHRSHYGLKAPLLVLWTFASRARQKRFLDLLGGCSERVRATVLTRCIDQSQVMGQVQEDLFDGMWQRTMGEGLRLAG